MKQIIFALLLLFTFSATGFAQVETPKMLSIQAVLIDGGGNVLYDLQETDINFKIIDGGGNVYYEEVQHVYMVNGAMSTLIGRGVDPATGQPTGGIPYEALEPDADRLIRFKLVDHTVPQEDMQIVSVPYAYYSEFADTLMEPLIGDLIANEAITLAHVSPELKNYIDNATDGISKQDLQDHITNDNAHDARDIVVSTPLKYSGGNTVAKALYEFDTVLEIWANKDGLFEKDITNITNKITGLEDGTTLDPRYVNVTGDTMTGNLDMGNNNITNINQITAITLSGDGGGITNISGTNVQEGTIASQQIKDGSIATADLANTNISQWTNDSKYITDGNTGWENEYGFIKDGNEGWDNTYGFITDGNQGWGNDYGFITDGNQGWGNEYGLITDGNQGWENEYGFITDGNQNWNNEYGFITQADIDGIYLKVSGGIMGGNIAMNDAACNAAKGPQDPKNCRVDGVDVSELEVRVLVLESAPTPDENIVPQASKPFAYGTCIQNNSEANGFNLSDCSTDVVTGLARQVYFTTPPADNAYVVQLTSHSDKNPYICGKHTTRFLVCQDGSLSYPATFDFVVFKN